MADTKITGLTANTTPVSTDVTVIVDDPAGVPLSQKITLENLMALFANPVSDDGDSLGTTALKWADLFLASGGVINFNNGNVTLTHSAGNLTLAGGNLNLAAGTTTLAPLKFASGTNLTTPEAGALEYDGKAFYATPDAGDRGVSPAYFFRALSANANGNDSATAQGWFPSNGAVAVAASTSYFFQGAISIVRSAGTTSHTTGVSMDGGSCTINQIGYFVEVKEGDASTISDSDLIAIQVATDTNIKAASTAATENIVFMVWGVVSINAAGTFKPMFKYSAAPGGTPVIELGTYFKMTPIGGTGGITVGTWT